MTEGLKKKKGGNVGVLGGRWRLNSVSGSEFDGGEARIFSNLLVLLGKNEINL